jgi:DUF1680 family protein
MKSTLRWALIILAFSTGCSKPDTVPAGDRLIPVKLHQTELSGEIGRRINDLIYKNFMVIDIDTFFSLPFKTRPFTDNGHYIGVGKVIDAGSLFAAYTGDPGVADRTSKLIGNIIGTRDPDGYIGTFSPLPGGKQNHFNWALHEQEYLLLGLTHNATVAGNPQSLPDARNLADYVMATFGQDPHPEEVCTAGLPEAFLALYGATGEQKYLDFAANIRHGNSKAEVQCASLLDWNQTFEGQAAHVYVMLARCYAQTELYRFMDRPSLLDMSHYMRHELLRKGGGLNVVGSASDGEWFSYTQNGAGMIGESCVTAYLMRWLESMMRLEGDLRYGDIMERTLYNALFAAQDPEGRRIRYFTPFTGKRVYFTQDGFCCPGNFRRIVAELPQKVYYTYPGGGIAVNLFTTSHTTITLPNGVGVAISQETDYPDTGHVVIRVDPERETDFLLSLRIPRWCRTATARINGGPPLNVRVGDGPYQIMRQWKKGDLVTLDMPMEWRLIRGHVLQEGKVALARGPVVYCLGTDQNEEALQKYPDFRGIVIDPAEIPEPVVDNSIRPDGRKVTLKARVEAPAAWSKGAAYLELTFTEFIDPSGIMTYFPVLDLSRAVEDELMTDCFQ